VRGRKPKPAEQRISEGRKRVKDAHPPLPVVVAGRPHGTLEKPADLPAEADEYWDDFVVRLDEAGILDRIDLPAARMMCVAYALFERARQDVEEFGMYALGSMGQVVVAPAVAIAQANAALYLRFAEQFAATPSARARLGLEGAKKRKLDVEMDRLLGPNNRRVD
jgi:P27 family predicted phage terminase small subunit